MVMFWMTAIGMAVLAGAILLVPLWRGRSGTDIGREKLNAELFKERLAEFEAEHREGHLSDQELEQLRRELEHTLWDDVHQQPAKGAGKSTFVRGLAYGIVVLMPLIALGYYYTVSYRGEAEDWIAVQQRLDAMAALAMARPEALPAEAFEDLPDFIRVLQARIAREGMNDTQSLHLLGVSYIQLQQPRAALAALERAHNLEPEHPGIMLAYAQATMMLNEGRLTETSAGLLHSLLQRHPDHQGALLLFGFGAFNSGAYAQAIGAWKTLLAMRDSASESARLLSNSIARAERLLAEQSVPAETGEAAETGPRIAVTVDLAPELQSRLTSNDTLFIFAKASDGPPMPLAVVRQPAEEFPVNVVLDDSQAMMPAMKLSNFQQVVVGARISREGNVDARSGDLQGMSDAFDLDQGTRSVALVIDQVVP